MAEYVDIDYPFTAFTDRGQTIETSIRKIMQTNPFLDIPIADVVERKYGKWILYNAGFGFTHHCSNCNFAVKEQWIGFYNFCPNCGADMRDESEDIPMEYFESGGK